MALGTDARPDEYVVGGDGDDRVTRHAGVIVRDATRGTVIADRCRVARSVRDRMVGLLGTDRLDEGAGLWIERSPSIHMFFMRYAIDAVFVDGDGLVTRTVSDLRPWRMVIHARGGRDCIELPVGTISRAQVMTGDRITREPSAVIAA